MTLPTDPQARKNIPLARGLLDYFADALCAVAECSRIGNEQHSPGQPLHWAKEKSTDEADALLRHLIERGTVDSDGVRASAKVAWRALALLQREIEAERMVATPDAQRPGEDARAHRDRVNTPWASAVAFENGPDRTPIVPTSLGMRVTAKSGYSGVAYQDLENYRRECRHDLDRALPAYRQQYARQPDDFASDGL